MATNYPTSLDSYTTKVDNTDDVMASHINNTQDAIEALEAKVGVDSSAVTTSHDYKLANACKNDGTTVFNTTITAANTWQDLDLSSYVGSNFAIVHLEIKCTANYIFYAKPKGYGSSSVADHSTYYSSGGGAIYFDGTNRYGYMTMSTDTSGVIQIAANSTSPTFTVKVVGFVKNSA